MYLELLILLPILCLHIGELTLVNGEDALEKSFPESVLEDARIDTEQMVRKYGYPAETHYITTEDKYILRMHRIAQPKGQPVLLVHGLMDSSATWVLMGPWSALGFFLYDNGYDVWMGNVRGNRYSRNHTIFDPNTDKSYWKFSWHEIGFYDVPAMVDYVLQETAYTKLGYFGHSQGTTAFWVMCSMRPSYNDKITLMHALAPVAYTKHVRTPMLSYLKNFIALSGDMVREFLPHNDLLYRACMRTKLALDTCVDSIWQLMGKNPEQINMTRVPVVMGHMPAGCNLRQWEHYIQLVDADRFCQFDHGPLENMRVYGKRTPPDYPLQNIRAPVALHYAYNDYLSGVVDVQRLAKQLPNVVHNDLYPYKKWNHVSMLWGIDARELTHRGMINRMRNFEL